MELDGLLTILEHGGLALVLYLLLQRVMARLDTVTDKLITILEGQRALQAQLLENQSSTRPDGRS